MQDSARKSPMTDLSPPLPPPAETTRRVGYVELVRTNANFRRLWFGDVASHLGDWFNTIAIYTLIERLTGSPLALGLVFITKSLPFALASPLAGLIADRVDRRRLMIVSDLPARGDRARAASSSASPSTSSGSTFWAPCR